MIYIVNAGTVSDLSLVMGLGGGASDTTRPALDPSQFCPNVVVSGVSAWSEFNWVRKCVYVGYKTEKFTLPVLLLTVLVRVTVLVR